MSPAQLEQVEALAAACVAADGGRLKLEFSVLRTRPGTRVDDFFWTVDGEIVGFLGLYAFGAGVPELAGMVHPNWRRQGIFSRLLQAAISELRARGADKALLVVHRGSGGGAGLVAKLGAPLEHSEHRMRQLQSPPPLQPGDEIVVRLASEADAGFVARCLMEAFDLPRTAVPELEAGMYVIEDDGDPVGAIRVDRHEATSAGIYGFSVLPERQGKGIGRRVLTQVTNELRDDGVTEVHLEVAVENDNALRLYERCGFDRLGTEDYFELQLGRA